MQVTFPDGTPVTVRDAIILARLSKKVQGGAQTGIYSQDVDARDWAEAQGYNVAATVADHITGTSPMQNRRNARPWVTQPDLMAQYQMIVAAKHDRLTRADWRDEGDLRRWAENNHKVLILVEEALQWPPRNADDRQRWNNAAEQSRREWEATSRRYKRMQRFRRDHNYLYGRPTYGYRSMGVDCQQSPCRCIESKIDDFKTLVIYGPEAKVIREAKTRYLAGEAIADICDDFNKRGIASPMFKGQPGKAWYPRTLAKLLRNPATAGRRMDNRDADEKDRKTILTYPGIITWQEHEQLAARLDSRAHRKGISPSNVAMLTSSLFCQDGHPMYRVLTGRPNQRLPYYYSRKCGTMVRLDRADEIISEAVLAIGHEPYMVKRVIPGKNHFDEIARLRQDRNELDESTLGADEYDRRHAEITAEIRRLTKLDIEHPEPDRVAWVKTGKTIAQHWRELGDAGRRDWLRDNGWIITAIIDDESPDGFRLMIDAGWTKNVGIDQQLESLGVPVSEIAEAYASLPETLGIGKDQS